MVKTAPSSFKRNDHYVKKKTRALVQKPSEKSLSGTTE